MHDRKVIHSRGRLDWQLAVVGTDVTASIHVRGDESVIYTTADFGLTQRDAGRDDLSPEQVVVAYRKRARPEPSFDDLLARVREAMDRPTTDSSTAVSQHEYSRPTSAKAPLHESR